MHDVVEHGAEACNYLLAVDVDMNTVPGYAMSSWETGYGDFEMKPDFDTLRPVSWIPGTAMCMADLHWHDDSPVVASPRQILKAQLDRLAERGWNALAATELEFIIFRDTYEEAFHKAYRDLEPGNLYNVDYSILGTSRLEPLLGRIRREMAASDLPVENSKGECNFGQHEINFRYADAVSACDLHVIYKNAAKEIASLEGMSISFMAKYDEREGNSCHIHLSLRSDDDSPVFADDDAVYESFLAGQLAVPARADALPGAQRQLLQALRRRARSRPRRWRGDTTTARARSACSARATRSGSSAGCRAATSTRTSPWRR